MSRALIQTILLVVEDLNLLLFRAGECLHDDLDGIDCGQRAVKEVTSTWFLHHLGTWVAAQLTETVVAEDDRLAVHLSVSDDEVSIYEKK